jgi:hypothetical protein
MTERRYRRRADDYGEWFWAKLSPPTPDGCREWTGYRMHHGHGRLMGPDGHLELAHRVAWKLTFGPIPDGMFVCHHCDNGACCESSHLFLGTNADNMADMVSKGRGRNRNGKIPDAMKDEIRGRLAAGERVVDIAAITGVSRQSVSAIKNGRSH